MSNRVVEQRIRSARRWIRRAAKRKTCEAAYSDLLLATKDFGVARGYVYAAPREIRVQYEESLSDLEEVLLVASHAMRPKCRR